MRLELCDKESYGICGTIESWDLSVAGGIKGLSSSINARNSTHIRWKCIVSAIAYCEYEWVDECCEEKKQSHLCCPN